MRIFGVNGAKWGGGHWTLFLANKSLRNPCVSAGARGKLGRDICAARGGCWRGPVQCETSVRSVGAVPCVEVGAAAACALSVRPSGGQDTHELDIYQHHCGLHPGHEATFDPVCREDCTSSLFQSPAVIEEGAQGPRRSGQCPAWRRCLCCCCWPVSNWVRGHCTVLQNPCKLA